MTTSAAESRREPLRRIELNSRGEGQSAVPGYTRYVGRVGALAVALGIGAAAAAVPVVAFADTTGSAGVTGASDTTGNAASRTGVPAGPRAAQSAGTSDAASAGRTRANRRSMTVPQAPVASTPVSVSVPAASALPVKPTAAPINSVGRSRLARAAASAGGSVVRSPNTAAPAAAPLAWTAAAFSRRELGAKTSSAAAGSTTTSGEPAARATTTTRRGLFGNGTAASPDGGWLIGSGYSYTAYAGACTSGACDGGKGGLFGKGGNGFNGGNGGAAGWFGSGGDGGAGVATVNNGAGGSGGAGGLFTGNGGKGGAGADAILWLGGTAGNGGAGGNTGALSLIGAGGKGGAGGIGYGFRPSTANQPASLPPITHFNADTWLMVSLAIPNAPSGTTFKFGSYAGLRPAYGYNFTGEKTELNFYGTPTDVNAALAALLVSTGAAQGSFDVGLTASFEGSYSNAVTFYYSSSTNSYYKHVNWPGITWTSARNAALAQTLHGATGYLANITTEAENQFIANHIALLEDNFEPIPATNFWIGGSDKATAGTWQWVDGPEGGTTFWIESLKKPEPPDFHTGAVTPPFNYASWALYEPNNVSPYPNDEYGDDSLVTNCKAPCGAAPREPNGRWNDLPDNGPGFISGYLVEFTAPSGGWTDAEYGETGVSQRFTRATVGAITGATGADGRKRGQPRGR